MHPKHDGNVGLVVRRPGFTLVELLVVIAIIGLLIALLLPAVQSARESSRRSSCQNNLKQLGLGLHNHLSAKKTFPPRGVWGIETGSPPFTENHHSWITLILPYLEQQALASGIDLNQRAWGRPHLFASLPTVRCPSDPFFLNPRDTRNLTITNYAGCEGYDWWPAPARYGNTPAGAINASVNTVFESERYPGTDPGGGVGTPGRPVATKPPKIRDGLSKTLLLGEVTSVGFFGPIGGMGQGVPGTPSRAYSRAAFIDITTNGSVGKWPWKQANGGPPGTGHDVFMYTTPAEGSTGPAGVGGPVFMTYGGINSQTWGANSFHLGFIQIITCDGAVRTMRETTDWRIWNLMCSFSDDQVISE